ncbi:hypothetical protein HWB60_gp092 [Mycobacterium phage TChen]|uniref:Uncharacterized protein n=1 Tax=Mycobacterium phage TChen TaxID=2163598 RepID=A0A2S1PD48_9CAUD|nr:hypothetical protein HWB60_gp092 [Mycobacterium phage TChen]AWH14486.1 hypothetical protein SEA_TCHEN_92 [Mycobacterium phage TChen]
MPTFTPPTPLTAKITLALCALRQAREDGNPQRIYVAEQQLDRLLDRLPRSTHQER